MAGVLRRLKAARRRNTGDFEKRYRHFTSTNRLTKYLYPFRILFESE